MSQHFFTSKEEKFRKDNYSFFTCQGLDTDPLQAGPAGIHHRAGTPPAESHLPAGQAARRAGTPPAEYHLPAGQATRRAGTPLAY